MSPLQRLLAFGRRSLRRNEEPADARRIELGGVAFLNARRGLPSEYAGLAADRGGGGRAVFLDYNYLARDADRWRAAIAAARVDRTHDRTLLLAARGLDPIGPDLLALARDFADHHVFVELWNMTSEVFDLAAAGLEHLYFLPVTAAIVPLHVPAPMSAAPNRRVFVSLGGDDDLDLLAEVVRRRRDLHFFVPDVSWTKGAAAREAVGVSIDGRNVTQVPCRNAGPVPLLVAYRAAYAVCDTVLIATRAEKKHQMRGGIRVADALAWRKRIVLAENPMCELLMAQPERTCVVAPHDASAIAGALERVLDGSFRVDRDLYEEIRGLTRVDRKLRFILGAATDPEAARGSAFFRDRGRLERDLERLPPVTSGGVSVLRFGQLACGASFEVPGVGGVRVGDIRFSALGTHEVRLEQPGAPPLTVLLSTDPASPCYRQTRGGHRLAYRGKELSVTQAAIVERFALLV